MDNDLKNRFYHKFEVECLGPDGELKWSIVDHNLVVNTGLDDILDKYWKGSGYTSSHFVGLMDSTPTVAAADTMASHAGWTEIQDYTEGTREALTLGAVASQSVDNSASKASYSVNATVTIGGSFITTNSTKGGTTGTLIGAVAFAGGDKSADSGDTLNVTVTLSTSSS